ncbi:MAG: hypothetical protein JG782_1091 [Anaerophaga sp.]|nr:hypothetical protein [Anaerophaga sp.]MDI3520601.1 hypothetical protein [Anaerophaga sp.]MDN5290557.1 hypothetical protein [Anaerophaga sp.]
MLIYVIQLKQEKVVANNNNSNLKNNPKDELYSYQLNFTTNLVNSNLQLNGVTLKDTLNNIIPLKQVFLKGQRQILVCRFSKMHCASCVDFVIQLLQNWTDSIGKEKILFLGNHRNNRIFKREIPLYGIQDMNVYNTYTFNIPVEELGFPYYFILDSNLQISNVFIPDKATPNITNLYLKKINEKFNGKNNIFR